MKIMGLLLCFFLPSLAGAASLNWVAPARTAQVGQPLNLTLELLRPEGASALPPLLTERQLAGRFLLLSSGQKPTKKIGSEESLQVEYRLLPLKEGAQILPSLNSAWGKTDPLKLKVAPGKLPQPQKPQPLSAPWSPWPLLGALLLFLGFAFWRLRPGKKLATLPPRLSPLEQLQADLEQLRSQLPQASGEWIVRRLSWILRQYLTEIKNIPALAHSTEEFLNSIQTLPSLTTEQLGLLAGFFSFADQVKFAKTQPDPGQTQEAFNTIRRFITPQEAHGI